MNASERVLAYRNSVTVRISEQEMAMRYGFRQLGHMEPVAPTLDQIHQHTRAVFLRAEIQTNPYLYIDGYDSDVSVLPLETERWVADETDEQWMARWREHRATHPDEEPPRSPFDNIMASMFEAADTESLPTLNMSLWRTAEPECNEGATDD